ncbi:hypothetical protein TSAR_010161 [Trichomalopsis sarcophagae]|uniref:Uncharacterized protein n=1 Tax=Trichomalopsis sarcophagae TaxID=543379 RepID=A0A232FMB2_9HYME|nr:hypothetical protein TSAR_010161 [Trichomalopsis sarcophagae]
MSLLNAQDFLGKFCARYVISLPKINLSRSQKNCHWQKNLQFNVHTVAIFHKFLTPFNEMIKILIICLTSGTLLLGSLAQFLKRRRRHPIPPSRRHLRDSRQRLINSKASNFDAVSQASWARRSEASTRGSHISDRASLISSVPGGLDGDTKLTPQQYGVLESAYHNCLGLGIFLLFLIELCVALCIGRINETIDRSLVRNG